MQDDRTNWTAEQWHRYIRSAPSFAKAQDRIEEASAAGVDFAALVRLSLAEQDS